MSLFGVPFVRFPSVASSPTCCLSRPSASSTSLERTRLTSCSSAHWSGMSGCLANPTPHAGYESNFCTYRSARRSTSLTATGVSRTARSPPQRTPKDFQHSGASSSSKHTAASRVPAVSGSLGNSLWKQMADYESVDSRNGMQEIGANLDREPVVKTLFSSQSKWKRDRDFLSTKSLNGKLTRPSEERDNGSANICGRRIGKRETPTLLFRIPIRSLVLNDFSNIKQVDWHIRLSEVKITELSMQQERNPTTVSQRMAQIRELPNKVNSLSDARELYDPESGSSSGATHVPDRTSTVLSPRTLPRCDSRVPRDTQKLYGYYRKRF